MDVIGPVSSTNNAFDPTCQLIINQFLASHRPAVTWLTLWPSSATLPLGAANRLPLEMVIRICDFCLFMGAERTNIMLISQLWYAAMQSPTLWGEIPLRVSTRGAYIHASHLVSLMKRLVLSQSAPLDAVILNGRTMYDTAIDINFATSPDYLPLRTVISHCETHRWRSLSIHHIGTYTGEPLDFATPNLKSLTLWGSTISFFTSSGLLRLMIALKHSLLHVEFRELNDEILPLLKSRAMGSLHSFRGAGKEVLAITNYSVLQELEIRDSIALPELAFVPLPPTLHIIPPCHTLLFQRFDVQNVRNLVIWELHSEVYSPDTTVVFPSLRTLTILRGDITSILYLSAPMLHTLHIGAPETDVNVYRRTLEKNVMIVLRDLPHHIKLEPRMLVCHLPLSIDTTLFLLARWSNLEELSLRLARPFDIRWLVADLLKHYGTKAPSESSKMQWKYLPALKWLKLEADELGTHDWDAYAKRILEGRKGGNLTCVAWNAAGKGGGAVSL